MKNNTLQPHSETPKDVILVDFQKFLSRLLSFWWLFVLCIIVSVAISNFYLRYTTFEYASRAILLIKDAGNSGNISEQSILSLEQLSSGVKSMDNEIQILKSLSIIEKVVARLGLNIAYYRQGKVKESELYTNSPFLLDSFELIEKSRFGITFFLELKDYESFLFKETEEEEEGKRFYFGVPFETDVGRFLISLSPEKAIVPGSYRLTVTPLESAAYKYRSLLNVERIGSQSASSVLELSILDPVPEKARDILNTLIDIYNEEEINDENIVFRNTLDFIDKRVGNLINELDSVEGGIQQYKSANEIIGTSASSSMDYTLSEIRNALQQMSDYEVQKNLLESLAGFLTGKQSDFSLIPANLVAETPVLSGMVNQYNSLVLQYNQISKTASDINPMRITLEEQLIGIRDLILETIQNLKRDLQIPIDKIEKNIVELKTSMGSIPSLEKKLIEKMRTQAVKEKLFLYLLQKREETALSEAVTTAKTRTIDKARATFVPVYPKPKLVKIAGGILGFLVPFFFVMILGYFENKIDSEETIKQLTNIPILGRIAQKKGDQHIVVKEGSRSAINEMFRLLRTNLNFINNGKAQQTIMVTSSVSGEGKTFIALNLGITLALSNKKVMLLGLDLRKPKLGFYLDSQDHIGVTNYLVGQNSLSEITQSYKDNPNLFYITSGPTPPNPAELILSGRMEQLLNELAGQYDYILIDTPPIGLVSDALLLRKFIDSILVIVRHKFTRKIMIKNLEMMYEKKEIEKANIIFNGVKMGKSYYGYGAYKYGYQKEYYVEDD